MNVEVSNKYSSMLQGLEIEVTILKIIILIE